MEKKINGMMDVKMNGKKVEDKKGEMKSACPCCCNYTLKARGELEICPVCFWMDEGFTAGKWDEISKCNGISLNEARKNYDAFGACSKKYVRVVRKPYHLEIPKWMR